MRNILRPALIGTLLVTAARAASTAYQPDTSLDFKSISALATSWIAPGERADSVNPSQITGVMHPGIVVFTEEGGYGPLVTLDLHAFFLDSIGDAMAVAGAQGAEWAGFAVVESPDTPLPKVKAVPDAGSAVLGSLGLLALLSRRRR